MFQLDLKSRKSIYEQIVGGVKAMISRGELGPDDRLMSVREMSASLTVNPNTIQKAYSRLESEGWIYTVAGRGAFVSAEKPSADAARINEIYGEIGELAVQLVYLGELPQKIAERVLEIAGKGVDQNDDRG